MIQGLTEILTRSTAIQDAIGQVTGGTKYKVFPVVAPKDAKAPYIVMFETSRPPIRCKGVRATEYTFSANVVVYAGTYQDANTIAEMVEDAMDVNNGEHAGLKFKDLRYDSRQDGFDNEAELFIKIVQVSGHVMRA